MNTIYRIIAVLVVLGILALSSIGISNAAQLTSWEVANEPQMFLDVSITSTQTSSIVLSSPQLNGADWTFATTTGGVLRIRQGFRREDISYDTASVSATTNKVTLSGVVRNICPQNPFTLVTCGDGQSFSKGAIVELTVDSRLLNLKLNRDRVNLLSGSGQIAGTGTGQAILDLPCVTTTQRDVMTNVSDGQLICNSTLGTFQYRSGSNWISFGSGSAINATTAASGKVEIATTTDVANKTITGDSGAKTVIPVEIVTSTSTGSTQANKIAALLSSGFLSTTLGGTGSGSYAASGILLTNGSNTMTRLAPGTTGKIVKSNGEEWASASPDVDVLFASGAFSAGLTSNSGEQNFNRNYIFSANTFTTGQMYEFVVTGTGASGGGTSFLKARMGTTELCRGPSGITSIDNWTIRGTFTIQATGGSGRLRSDCVFNMANSAGSSGALVTVDTTASQTLQISYTDSVTNAADYAFITSFMVRLLTP